MEGGEEARRVYEASSTESSDGSAANYELSCEAGGVGSGYRFDPMVHEREEETDYESEAHVKLEGDGEEHYEDQTNMESDDEDYSHDTSSQQTVYMSPTDTEPTLIDNSAAYICHADIGPVNPDSQTEENLVHFMDDVIKRRCLKERRKVKARNNPEYRERERVKNLERTRKLRMDPEFRDKERVRNRVSKQRARLDPMYREAERVRNRLQKRKAREDPAYREAERVRNMWQKRRAREDPDYRMRERMKDVERKREKRWGMKRTEEEWMEIGAVEMDDEARVAFQQGLYRLIPSDPRNYWEESQAEWDHGEVKGDPDWYHPFHLQEPLHHWQSQSIYRYSLNESQVNHSHFSHKHYQMLLGKHSFSDQLCLPNNHNPEWKEIIDMKTEARAFHSWDEKSVDPLKRLKSNDMLNKTVLPVDFCKFTQEIKSKYGQVSDSKSAPVKPVIDHMLKVNLNDIEILPLSTKSEPTYPNLNWQIEVLRVSKKPKDLTPPASLHMAPPQSSSSLDKLAKPVPQIQV